MNKSDRKHVTCDGTGIELRALVPDGRELSSEEFEDRHGSAFLLVTASQLQDPRGPAATVVELGEFDGPTTSATAALAVLVYSVRRSGRSVGHLLTIGRASNNDVSIKDQSVSRFHAFLKQLDDERFEIQDAGSTNGTTVNGSSVPSRGNGPSLELKSGDNLRIGQVDLTFVGAQAFQEYLRQIES